MNLKEFNSLSGYQHQSLGRAWWAPCCDSPEATADVHLLILGLEAWNPVRTIENYILDNGEESTRVTHRIAYCWYRAGLSLTGQIWGRRMKRWWDLKKEAERGAVVGGML